MNALTDGLVFTATVRIDSEPANVPDGVPFVTITMTGNDMPGAPGVDLDVHTNLQHVSQVDQSGRELGIILHQIAHVLIDGATINLTPPRHGSS